MPRAKTVFAIITETTERTICINGKGIKLVEAAPIDDVNDRVVVIEESGVKFPFVVPNYFDSFTLRYLHYYEDWCLVPNVQKPNKPDHSVRVFRTTDGNTISELHIGASLVFDY